MGDFKAIVGPTQAALRDMSRRVDRASMWALRETGRAVKTEAKRRAPVLKGAGTISRKRHKELGGGHSTPPVAGLLKASISSSKRLRKVGAAYVVKVGPRGDRVHLYAGKAEAANPYMKPAHEAAAARMGDIHANAWARAMKRS